jgi:hypothetical protein
MGLDLSVVPVNYHQMDWWLGNNRLGFNRDYFLFEQIDSKGRTDLDPLPKICNPKPLPPNVQFDWYDDEGLETITTDPYGTPLTYVTAGELAEVKSEHDWNAAIIAMMKALPPQTPVVLYWH